MDSQRSLKGKFIGEFGRRCGVTGKGASVWTYQTTADQCDDRDRHIFRSVNPTLPFTDGVSSNSFFL